MDLHVCLHHNVYTIKMNAISSKHDTLYIVSTLTKSPLHYITPNTQGSILSSYVIIIIQIRSDDMTQVSYRINVCQTFPTEGSNRMTRHFSNRRANTHRFLAFIHDILSIRMWLTNINQTLKPHKEGDNKTMSSA